MTEIAAEQYIANLYGTGEDAGPALSAMTDGAPDFSTIRFNQVGGTLTLAKPWIIKGKTGLRILGPVLIEELPQLHLQQTGNYYSELYSGAASVILDSCGHCEFSGFWIHSDNPGEQNYGILVTGSGSPRISTNNTIAYNRITNRDAYPEWFGIIIARFGRQNNEAMQLLHNWIEGGGAGVGIYVGDDPNNHMHFMFRNTTYQCDRAIDGTWAGFHSLHHISESDNIVFNIRHMSYPVLIEYPDVEGSKQVLVAGHDGGESSLIMRGGRFASCGAPGVAQVDIGPYLTHALFESNDWQNYSGNGASIYSVQSQGRGLIRINDSFGNWLAQGGPPERTIVHAPANANNTPVVST